MEGMVKMDVYLQDENTQEVELATVASRYKNGN